MEGLQKLRIWTIAHRFDFIEAFRVYLGVALLLKGLSFVSNAASVHEALGASGIDMGQAFFAHLISAIHIIGGLMLAVGLYTRFAALIQIPIVLGAIFFVHLREGLFTTHPNLELAGIALMGLIVFAGYGSGSRSADAYISNHGDKEIEFRRPFLKRVH